MPYNTGNPVPSTDARDFMDNVQNTDVAVNTQELTWTDRLGVARKTFAGMEADFADRLGQLGYVRLGDYAAGIVITDRRQVFLRAGEYYRAAASLSLPYTTTGDWVTESSSFVGVGDAVLRQDLSGPTGTEEIGRGAGTLESALDALESANAANAQAVQDVDNKVDSLNGTTLGYSQNTGVRAENLSAALDFLGRSGKEGIFTTPASLGHRAGQLAYRITAGGKAELISDLRKHYPAGAFVTPSTIAATGLKAYYVKPTGSDAAAGTDWGTALASVPAALAKTDVDVVFIAAGLYTSGKVLPTYAGTRDVALHAVGGDVLFVTAPAGALTAWSTTGNPELFRKTSLAAAPAGVVALDFVDEYGLPLVLPYRGTDSATLVGNTGYVAYESGGLWTVFIRLPGGAAPVMGRVLYYEGATMRMAAPGVKFYHAGITYIGGSAGAFSARGGNASSVVVSERCKFAGQRPYDAYQIKDIGLSIAINCIGAKSGNDCFNYHALNGVTPHFIEVNCIGVGAEAAGTGNGSTAHEDVVGIRIGCDYSGNAGPGIADVNDAVTYNAGCTSRGNATYGVVAQADSKVGAGALVYLHACSVGGNTSEDVAARVDGRVKVLDAFYATQLAELGGTITAF